MQFMAVIIASVGAYLINSGYKNRAPITTLKALIADPSHAREILDNAAGISATTKDIGKSVGSGTAPTEQANSGENGKLPDSALQRITFAPTHRLVPSAAAALEKMNAAYRSRFGVNISITDSYRTYAEQVALKAAKPTLAGTPGTSNHGWGKALDLGGGIQRWGSSQRAWMVENAPAFGWRSPAWAQQGGSKPEPWHWEYGGTA